MKAILKGDHKKYITTCVFFALKQIWQSEISVKKSSVLCVVSVIILPLVMCVCGCRLNKKTIMFSRLCIICCHCASTLAFESRPTQMSWPPLTRLSLSMKRPTGMKERYVIHSHLFHPYLDTLLGTQKTCHM